MEGAALIPVEDAQVGIVLRDDVLVVRLTCPNCGTLGDLDEDQVNGDVSIECPNDECSFHEIIEIAWNRPITGRPDQLWPLPAEALVETCEWDDCPGRSVALRWSAQWAPVCVMHAVVAR